jgi:hypothetical protein
MPERLGGHLYQLAAPILTSRRNELAFPEMARRLEKRPV